MHFKLGLEQDVHVHIYVRKEGTCNCPQHQGPNGNPQAGPHRYTVIKQLERRRSKELNLFVKKEMKPYEPLVIPYATYKAGTYVYIAPSLPG